MQRFPHTRVNFDTAHTHTCTHSYVIEEGICYLALCEPTYPPQLAFSYLDNLHKDFSEQHGHNIHRAHRPYHFIEFGQSHDTYFKLHQPYHFINPIGPTTS